MPLLIEALRHRRFKKVQLGLQVGLNVNERDPTNLRTPLIELSFLDPEAVAARLCKRLLDKGAKIKLRDNDGRNALLCACLKGRQKLVEVLLLEAQGFDLNDQDHQGNTALCLAVKSGNFVIVKMLLKVLKRYKLSVDVCNNHGETPLILASKTRNSLITEILIFQGKASTEIRDKERYLTAKEWESVRETQMSRNESSLSLLGHGRYVLSRSRHNSNHLKALNLRQSQSCGSPSQIEVLGDVYKDELYQLFSLYYQQLTISYKPSAIPPSLKDENILPDHSILSDIDADYSVCCPVGLDQGSRTCSILPFHNKRRLSISKAAQIPLSVNKTHHQRIPSIETNNKLTSLNFRQGQTRTSRRGSINVLQKPQAPVRKRHSSPLLRQPTANTGEMSCFLNKFDSLTEKITDD